MNCTLCLGNVIIKNYVESSQVSNLFVLRNCFKFTNKNYVSLVEIAATATTMSAVRNACRNNSNSFVNERTKINIRNKKSTENLSLFVYMLYF